MDGPVAEGGLANAATRFDLATDADDAETRRIARENPMAGQIWLSLEREPDARTAAAIEGPLLHQTVVGRRPGGGLFGTGTRSVRLAYINGQRKPLGYLSSLRLDVDYRRNAAVLRQGYSRLEQLHRADGVTPMYLTSIMSDNRQARRVLEAGLPGFPTYRPVGELVTLVIAVGSSVAKGIRQDVSVPAGAEMDASIRAFQSTAAARRQFAPSWADQPLAPTAEDTRIAFDQSGRIIGIAALWDQRPFKQTVVRGYATALRRSRWLVNAWLALGRRPSLPPIGTALKSAYVTSLLTADDVVPEVTVALIEAIRALARTRGLDYLCVGLPADDPRLTSVCRAFKCRLLRSQLYVVFWPDGRASVDALDDRPLGVEVALL